MRFRVMIPPLQHDGQQSVFEKLCNITCGYRGLFIEQAFLFDAGQDDGVNMGVKIIQISLGVDAIDPACISLLYTR